MFAYTWLYVVGTAGFSCMAYGHVSAAYDLKSRTKHLIEVSLQYAQYHDKDKPIWQRFKQDKFLGVEEFLKLLESAGVLLSDAEVDDLIREINANGDSVVTEEELESYLDSGESGRHRSIFFNCLRNFNFVSNLSYIIGAIGYATAYYSTGRVQIMSSYCGAIGYFMGGIAYVSMACSMKRSDLEWLKKMKHAIERILRANNRRGVLWSRLSQLQSDFDGDNDVFNFDLDKEPLEDFLTSLVSCTSERIQNEGPLGTVNFLSGLEWTSTPHPTLIALLMYQVTLRGDGEQYTGFIITPCFCGEEDMAKISATISKDGSKILLNLPRHLPPLEEGIKASKLLCANYFSPECTKVFTAEAKLPWHIDSKSRVSAPAVIYSHGGTRSVVHLQLKQDNHGACLDSV